MRIKKRTIMAAADIDTAFNGAFSEIAGKFQDVKYEMSVDKELNMTLECVDDDKARMPEITTKKEKTDDGVYYYIPTLTFPKLNDADLDFYDSIHYYLSKWEKVGRVITDLIKFNYNPSESED